MLKKCAQLRNKRSAPEQTPQSLDEEKGYHAVTTPTTMAAKAPSALNTFLDPLLLLLLLPAVFEGLEPPEVPLGDPELEPPELGVAVGSG